MMTVRNPYGTGAAGVLVLLGWLCYRGRAHLAYMPLVRALPALVILGVSLLVSVLFMLAIILSPERDGAAGGAGRFGPSYPAIRACLRERPCLWAAVLGAAGYAAIFIIAEGAVSREPAGPRWELLWEGVPGYAPQIVLFPFRDLGIVLSAYQVAAALCLSGLFGVNMALLVRLRQLSGGWFARGKSLGLGVGGAAGGLLLSCPSCAATPLVSLISTALLPAGSFLQQIAGSMLTYFISLALVFAGLTYSSRAAESGGACPLRAG